MFHFILLCNSVFLFSYFNIFSITLFNFDTFFCLFIFDTFSATLSCFFYFLIFFRIMDAVHEYESGDSGVELESILKKPSIYFPIIEEQEVNRAR